MFPRARLILGSVLAGLALMAISYCAFFYASRQAVESGDPYVDSEACRPCHAHIFETYQHTGMGRSFSRPGPENTVEDYTTNNAYYHAASDRHYTMYEREGRYYQRRHQVGFDGKETNVIEKEIHFMLGSGNHARTYLHRAEDGKLVELPIAWYSEEGGFWAMNPGYDRPDHDGFRRRITHSCMFCHNGYPKIEPGSDTFGTDSIFKGKIPEGIDCQRCHGPGRDHIQAVQTEGATLETIRGAIVNPARLNPERQMDVCMQCHLETTSARLPNFIRRYERGAFSFRPGEDLDEYILHFDHAPGSGYDDKFEIVSAAYRLRMSACFQASDGDLTCITCHNPHDIPRGEEAVRHYVGVCQSCHSPALDELVAAGRHTRSEGCLSCHMPKRRTEDVVHVVMTDHFIQRQRQARDLLAPLQEKIRDYEGEVVLYQSAEVPSQGEKGLYLAVAQVKENSNLEQGIPRLEKAIRQYQPERSEFYFELAEAYFENGNMEKAVPMYEETLHRHPDFWPALRKLGVALSNSGEFSKAAEVLRKASEIARQDATSLNDLSLVYRQQGRLEEGLAVLHEAIGRDPDFPEAYNNLGGVLLDSGDRASAEAAFRNAIRIQPDLASAHNNLANLLASGGDFPQAQYHFKKAIQSDSSYAATYYDYGIALAQSRQFNEARAQLEKAVQLNPDWADAHMVLGELLVVQGNFGEALPHFQEAAASADPAIRRRALESLSMILNNQ